MAISLLIWGRRAADGVRATAAGDAQRLTTGTTGAARYSYGAGPGAGPRVAAAALSLGIVGGVGTALMLGLVLPEVLAPTDEPIRVTNVAMPPPPPATEQPQQRPRDPAVTASANAHRMPESDGPIALVAPETGPINLGPALGGSGGTEVITPPPAHAPVLVSAARDPRFERDFQPDYPMARQREGVAGRCQVRVSVTPDGRVSSVAPLACADSAFFAATERQALLHWRYRPATRDGVAIAGERTETVRFELPQ